MPLKISGERKSTSEIIGSPFEKQIRSQFHTIHKNHFLVDLNMKKIRKKVFMDSKYGKWVFKKQKSPTSRKRTDNFCNIKIKNFFSSKDPIKQVKTHKSKAGK